MSGRARSDRMRDGHRGRSPEGAGVPSPPPSLSNAITAWSNWGRSNGSGRIWSWPASTWEKSRMSFTTVSRADVLSRTVSFLLSLRGCQTGIQQQLGHPPSRRSSGSGSRGSCWRGNWTSRGLPPPPPPSPPPVRVRFRTLRCRNRFQITTPVPHQGQGEQRHQKAVGGSSPRDGGESPRPFREARYRNVPTKGSGAALGVGSNSGSADGTVVRNVPVIRTPVFSSTPAISAPRSASRAEK